MHKLDGKTMIIDADEQVVQRSLDGHHGYYTVSRHSRSRVGFAHCIRFGMEAVKPEKAVSREAKPRDNQASRARQIIDRAKTRAIQAEPRSEEEIWAEFDDVRARISKSLNS